VWHASAGLALGAVLAIAPVTGVAFGRVQAQPACLAHCSQYCEELGVGVCAPQGRHSVQAAVVAQVFDEVLPAGALWQGMRSCVALKWPG
jgi:hypothetical protein